MNGSLGADGQTWKVSTFPANRAFAHVWADHSVYFSCCQLGCSNFVSRRCGESCLGPIPIFFEPASCFNINGVCVCVCAHSSEVRAFTYVGRHRLYMHVAHDPWCVFPRRQQDCVLKIDLVSGAEKVCVRVCAYMWVWVCVSVCVFFLSLCLLVKATEFQPTENIRPTVRLQGDGVWPPPSST